MSPSEELRVDTKSLEQSCCLYGLDMVRNVSNRSNLYFGIELPDN